VLAAKPQAVFDVTNQSDFYRNTRELKGFIMKQLFCLFSILLSVQCFSQKNKSTVTADIKGLGEDTLYILYYPLANIDSLKRDTITARNDRFTYVLPINEPAALAIMPKKSFFRRKGGRLYMPSTKFMELFLSPGEEIKIKGELTEYYLNFSMRGSKVNEQMGGFRKRFEQPATEAVRVELQLDSLSAIKADKEAIAKLGDIRGKLFNEIMRSKTHYIQQHLDDDLAAYQLTRLPLETFAQYYPKLTSRVREGMFGEVLKHTYKNFLNYSAASKAEKELIKGAVAPNFSLTTIEGKAFSLEQLRGKLIVLEFWGSWCGPCIQEFPKLKSTYEQYKTSVSFVGIACEEQEESWKKAVTKHGLSWTQLLNSATNDVSVQYGVKAFPTKIIIDQELKVVGRFVGATDEFYLVLKELAK